MIRQQLAERNIRDRSVLAAMDKVPRHVFVPPDLRLYAYADRPLPIGEGQTISQPYIVGLMTQILEIQESDNVLEIGTGSGYQAAVLAELCKNVYTIEIIPSLGKRAEQLLGHMGYQNIHIKIGDGYYGWPEHAPFDGIIVTAAAAEVPKALIDQLAIGGRLVMPVGGEFQVQKLMRLEKREDGSVSREIILPVRFVPLTGDH